VTIIFLLWFSRRDCYSTIFSHVSKVVTFLSFHFSAQRFKHVVTSSLCFPRPSWTTLLYMNFKVVYVHVVISAIHNFMFKIITCIT
jgi:hypothetical protein